MANEDFAQAPTRRKRQPRSLVTQHRLLDAAIAAFAENGFDGTSTRDIAARAGVHHPLITYHFENKRKLWHAAADRLFESFEASIAMSLDGTDRSHPRDRAAAFIRSCVRYAQLKPELHSFIVQESKEPSDRLDWLVETHLGPLCERTISGLQELQQLGVAPAGNPGLLFNMMRVSAGTLLALKPEIRATTGIDLELDEACDELADLIVRIFLPGDVAASD